MFCSKCGSEIADNSVFCSSCGAKIGEVPSEAAVTPAPEPTAAVTPTLPKFDLASFDIHTLIKLGVAVLAFIFSFLPICKISFFGYSSAFSILSGGTFGVGILLGFAKIFMILAILLFVVYIASLFVDLNQFVTLPFNIKEKAPLAFFGVYGIALIVTLLGTFTVSLCSVAFCWFIAVILCAAGLVLYFKPELLDQIIKK